MASPSGLAAWLLRMASPHDFSAWLLRVWLLRVCASHALSPSSKHLLAARVLRLTRLRFEDTLPRPIPSRL
jgi:hypothetical protein